MADLPEAPFKSIVPLIREQLPEFFLNSGSVIPEFLEAYYEWMEQEDNPSYVIDELGTQDINYTLDKFYSEFKEEYLDAFPNALATDKTNLLKNIREFYRSKGSEKAIKLLFRILYNEDVEIQYPSERVLKPSTGTWIQKTFVRVDVEDDDIFKAANREVFFLEQRIVVTDTSGTFQEGETVDSKDSLGVVYQTGEIRSVTNNEIIITTDFESQFIPNLTLEGRTSGATGRISESEDLSKRAFIERITKFENDGSPYYECELSGLFSPVKSNLVVRTIYNDDDNPLVTFRTAAMVVSATINDGGANYEEGASLTLSDNGSGTFFEGVVETVKKRFRDVPGTFTAVSPLPSAVLLYTPADGESLNSIFFPGDSIRIGTVKYEIASIDLSNNQVTFTENIAGGSDLSSIVKSYEQDTRAVASVNIRNPGIGYTTAPTVDLSGSGDGNADITLNIGGSFTQQVGYIDDKGHLSSSMRVQGDGIFQEFSYVVRSGTSIDIWRDAIKTHAHPAGILVSSEIFSNVHNTNTVNVTPYHRKRNLGGVNYNDPNAESTRSFYEPLLIIGGLTATNQFTLSGISSADSESELTLSPSIGGNEETYTTNTIAEGPSETIAVLTNTYSVNSIRKYTSKYQRARTYLTTETI